MYIAWASFRNVFPDVAWIICCRQDLCGIVVGGEDGIIRVYRMSPDIDTKSPEVFMRCDRRKLALKF